VTVPVAREESSDAELIRAWGDGDEGAAATLVRRHTDAVARYLSAAGAAGPDLEDLVQETFFRGFRGIRSYRGKAAFRTWLIAIASNVLRDAWRKRKRTTVLSIEDREFVDEASDPAGDAQARDLARRFRAALRRLPPLQRDVFLLRAQQAMAYDDIAAALDTTPGSARVHYHHAVKRLKATLNADD
jgi:RNA polymerase sigma-70 factor (ECF subfamily)